MKATVNGTELHYEVSGKEDAPWLVLSHSLASNGRMWDPQIAAFKDRYRILNYDMRGHGQSAVPHGPYSLDLLADDVLGLMNQLGIEHCTYVGLSVGGMIGQTLALRQTKRFVKMVLADTGHAQSPDVITQWEDRIRIAQTQGMNALVRPTMERWFTPEFRESPAAKAIASIFAATPVAGYVGCVQAIMQLNTTGRLKEITIPVLAIAGAADPSAAGTKQIAESVPGAKFVSIGPAAHISNIEQPGKFNEAVRAFL